MARCPGHERDGELRQCDAHDSFRGSGSETTLRNLRARRMGKPVMPIEQYFEGLAAASGLRKLVTRLQVESFVLHRKAARAKTAHRRALGNGLLLLAMALNPHDAYLKVKRRARAAWA